MTAAIAALVGAEHLSQAQVDAAVAKMRNGPHSHALPVAGTAEGRNLTRWVVQILTATRLVEQEAAARHITVPAGRPGRLSMGEALESGGIAAAVLAMSPAARAVKAAVTAGVCVPEAQVLAFYRRNLPRYTRPERRHVTRLGARLEARPGAPSGATAEARLETEGAEPLGWFRRGELPAAVDAAVFQAPEATSTGPVATPWGPWELRVDRVEAGRVLDFTEVRGQIAGELIELARTQSFSAWLARRQAEAVRLMPGFEHPSDPRNPDTTHRH